MLGVAAFLVKAARKTPPCNEMSGSHDFHLGGASFISLDQLVPLLVVRRYLTDGTAGFVFSIAYAM
jgi:hypothetical protein